MKHGAELPCEVRARQLPSERFLNPWTVGASEHVGVDGTGRPLAAPFTGAIDHLRISAVRQSSWPECWVKIGDEMFDRVRPGRGGGD